MKTGYFSPIVLSVLLVGSQLLRAASPAPDTLPTGSLLNATPDFSTWQIDYSYPGDANKMTGKTTGTPVPAPPNPNLASLSSLPPREIIWTRTKPLWHAVTVDTSGAKIEQWSDGNVRLGAEGGRPPSHAPSPTVDPLYLDFNKGFPDMDWISLAAFTGKQSMGGHSCLAFAKGDMKAWVDSETRYPVQWQRGGETRIFRQLPPPTSMLTIPPNFAQVLAAIQHDNALIKQATMRVGAP